MVLENSFKWLFTRLFFSELIKNKQILLLLQACVQNLKVFDVINENSKQNEIIIYF